MMFKKIFKIVEKMLKNAENIYGNCIDNKIFGNMNSDLYNIQCLERSENWFNAVKEVHNSEKMNQKLLKEYKKAVRREENMNSIREHAGLNEITYKNNKLYIIELDTYIQNLVFI